MDTPLRRSRRLGGLNPESTGRLTSLSQVRRALVEVESIGGETREPESLQGVLQPGPSSPRLRQETSPGSPSPRQDEGLGRPEPGPQSPPRQQEAGLESPRRQPELNPEPPQRQPKPCGKAPGFPQGQGELDLTLARSREDLTPGSSQLQPQLGPESPEPHPGQQAPGPEPSRPLQERLPQAPGSPRGQREPSQPPAAGETQTAGPWGKKQHGSSAQGPASKKLKKEQIPVIPKGKPKSGRVWKDRSKKRFSQMVQDKPLRTSWQRKMKERQERKLTKEFARHLEEEKEQRRQEKKQRRAENLKRRLENERKAEVVQVIRNPAKLKRAKKKQLRSIEKRDTLALLQKQPPQRPAAKV